MSFTVKTERRFLLQYIAVSREKRFRILIEQSFYSSVLFSVSDVKFYFLCLTFVHLFGWLKEV